MPCCRARAISVSISDAKRDDPRVPFKPVRPVIPDPVAGPCGAALKDPRLPGHRRLDFGGLIDLFAGGLVAGGVQAVQGNAGACQRHVKTAAAKDAAAVGKAERHACERGGELLEVGKLPVICRIGEILACRQMAHDAAQIDSVEPGGRQSGADR